MRLLSEAFISYKWTGMWEPCKNQDFLESSFVDPMREMASVEIGEITLSFV